MHQVIEVSFIFLNQNFITQEEVLSFCAKTVTESGRAENAEDILQGFYDREKEFSTAMNEGIAIPHCRSSHIHEATVMIVRNNVTIPWTDEGEEVDLFFALLVPEEGKQQHIRILASVAQLILEDEFIELVRNTDQECEIYKMMKSLNNVLQQEVEV